MSWQEISFFVDWWGIRVGGFPNGAEFSPYRAFPWHAVNQLSGYTIAEGHHTFVVLEIRHGDTDDDGEEVLSDWQDFPMVAAALSTHLLGLRPDWLDALSALSPTAAPITVWSRGALRDGSTSAVSEPPGSLHPSRAHPVFPREARLVSATHLAIPARPKSDRSLDASIALAAVQEQLPALECQRATHLGSGWAFDVYLLDDRFVARFPRNAGIARWVDWDELILRFVASALGSRFSVPKLVGRGTFGAHFPHDFLVCELVAGIGADRLGATDSEQLASDLGRVLTDIHSVTVDDASNNGVMRQEWDVYTGKPCFLHGDFTLDNVILDEASGRLVGVIDWGNAALGDPARDFVPLVLSRGWSFVKAVLAGYQRPVEDDFLERVRVNAQLQALQWLTDSVLRRADLQLHLTWMHNAFSSDSSIDLAPNNQFQTHTFRSSTRHSVSRPGAGARLIVVCGLPGSGKTTRARRLEVSLDAVRLCPDEWMEALALDIYDESERTLVEAMQWELARALLREGQTVVIEWGTWARAERDALRLGARAVGAAVELHYVSAPLHALFERVRRRGREDPPIELEDLQRWSATFQAPTPEELALYDPSVVADLAAEHSGSDA